MGNQEQKSYFWPIFIIVLAVLTAGIWKLAPIVFSWIPQSAIESIRDSARRNLWRTTDAPSPAGTEDFSTPADAFPLNAEIPASRTTTTKSPMPVAKTAQNPTGSPYLEAAAKALREYRRLSVGLKDMGLPEQRAAMRKLHMLNERVEFLNRKHREWKEQHSAKFPDR